MAVTTITLPDLILRGLAEGPARQELFTAGVGCAVRALRPTGIASALVLQVADTVAAAGVRPVAALSDPLRCRPAARLVRLWLRAAARRSHLPGNDALFATWLRNVGLVLAVAYLAENESAERQRSS